MKIKALKGISQKALQLGLLLMISFSLSSCDFGGSTEKKKTDPADTSPPGEATGLSITTIGGGGITLTWSDPGESDLDHMVISVSPADIADVSVAGGTGSVTLSGLTTRKAYTCTVKAVDDSDNQSPGISVTAFMPTASAAVTYITGSDAANFHTLLADDVTNGTGGYYILATNIDLSAYTWAAVGDNTTTFIGTLDGAGHTISNLTISAPADNYKGLFGYVGTGGAVFNVMVTNVNIQNNMYGGAVAGYNKGTVSYCSASGTIQGVTDIGGLVGWNDGTISRSSANVAITSGSEIGGLVGMNGSGTISNSYATGDVGDAAFSSIAGGLVGMNGGGVEYCYSSGAVAGTGNLGGFVGMLGGTGATYTSDYFNSTLAGQADTDATDIDLTVQGNFSGWDFVNTWAIDSSVNSGYPYLR